MASIVVRFKTPPRLIDVAKFKNIHLMCLMDINFEHTLNYPQLLFMERPFEDLMIPPLQILGHSIVPAADAIKLQSSSCFTFHMDGPWFSSSQRLWHSLDNYPTVVLLLLSCILDPSVARQVTAHLYSKTQYGKRKHWLVRLPNWLQRWLTIQPSRLYGVTFYFWISRKQCRHQ